MELAALFCLFALWPINAVNSFDSGACCDDLYLTSSVPISDIPGVLGPYEKQDSVYESLENGYKLLACNGSQESYGWQITDSEGKVLLYNNQSSACPELTSNLWKFEENQTLHTTNQTFLTLSVDCLNEKLGKCCQNPFFYYEAIGMSDAEILHENIDIILGGYKTSIAGLHNKVFEYIQVSPRHFEFADVFATKLKDIPIYIKQNYFNGQPRWEMYRSDFDGFPVACTESYITPIDACIPLNGWRITYDPTIKNSQNVSYNENHHFHGICLDDNKETICSACANDSICSLNFSSKSYECNCLPGFELVDGTCSLIKGNAKCFNCSGEICESPIIDQIHHCTVGIHTCKMNVTGYEKFKNLSFARSCGNSDTAIHQCIGVRRSSARKDYPLSLAGKERNALLRESVYSKVPFYCGSSRDCIGQFSTSDQLWHIFCKQQLLYVRCDAKQTKYSKYKEEIVSVACNGSGIVFRYLNASKALKVILAHEKEYDLDYIKQFMDSVAVQGQTMSAIPAYARYFLDPDAQVGSDFMSCSAKNNGIFCDCNSETCNSLNQEEFIHFFNSAQGKRNIFLLTLKSILLAQLFL